MRTIAIMNLKGGVGKTVTALTLADVLRRAGRTSVLVDCDGQMSLTRFYLPEFDPDTAPSVADVLMGCSETVWSDNTIKAAMGEAEAVTAGEYKITWKAVTTSRIDTGALRKAMPEIAAAFTRETTVRRFCVA